MRFIHSDEDLDWHIARLAEAHPVFAPLAAETGSVPIRWLDPGFKGLVFVVTGQQISIAAGRAIYNRLEAALGGITPEALAEASDDVLRAAGFSAPKIRTLRALQEAALNGGLDLAALERGTAGDAAAKLCAIKGIGPWTAEVYLLFAAGHPDIFPAADLALQEAARIAFALDSRPAPQQLRAMSDAWAPWRSAAARLLWAYYRVKKGGKAVAPV
ncbi:MAG: DNA-3-methyladenine glycosylase 2 family protein [Rhodomicrobium sp.]